MATFSFPTNVRPAKVDWHLMANSQDFTSPLTKSSQIAELPGARWMVTMLFEKYKRAEIGELEALIARLRGRGNRVTLWHHARENPQTGFSGSPLVNGSSQTGGTINIDNMGGKTLKPGDMVSIGGELKMVVVERSSSGGLQIEPPQRVAPGNNSSVICHQATGTFMLIDDNQGKFDYRRSIGGTTLTFIEDINA